MKFHLISDNVDTQVGLRMAGIEGVVLHEPDEVRQELLRAMAMPDVAVILMTAQLMRTCQELVDELKLTRTYPLIVEIPDRHGNGQARDSILRYVREAVGIKV